MAPYCVFNIYIIYIYRYHVKFNTLLPTMAPTPCSTRTWHRIFSTTCNRRHTATMHALITHYSTCRFPPMGSAKRRNSSAAALELRLFSTNPLIYTYPLYAIRKHAIYPPAASNGAVTQTIGSVVFPSRANYMWYIIYSQQQIQCHHAYDTRRAWYIIHHNYDTSP